MDLHRLRYFAAVAEELHFGRAAQKLHISQPPLSQQIRRLEENLGVPLFVRNRRSVALTAAGEELLRHVRPWLDEFDDFVRKTVAVGQGRGGRLRLAFTFSATATVLPSVIRAFRTEHPDIRLELGEMQIPRQVRALLDKEVDVGVLRLPVAEPDLRLLPLFEEPLVVALPAGHPLGGKPRLKLADLASESFVMVTAAPEAFARSIREACRAQGFEPLVSDTANDIQTALGLVSMGVGVTLVPEVFSRIRSANLLYATLEGGLRSTVAMAWRSSNENPALRTFLAYAGHFGFPS